MARWLSLVALVTCLVGCNKKPEPTPDALIEVGKPEQIEVSGPNAFDEYARLATRAVSASTVGLDSRDTGGNRRRSLAELGPLIEELAGATRLSCGFRFVATEPFARRRNHQGWLLLSRAIVWRIEAAVAEGDWEPAARWTVVASVFGADLCGGDVSDSTIGLSALEGSRRALAPYVTAMPPSALGELSAGLFAALQRMPSASVTLNHEGVQMSKALRSLQDALIKGKVETFAEDLYGRSRETVLSLKELSAAERNAMMQSLDEERERTVEQLIKLAGMPGASRGKVEVKVDGKEAVVASQFFSSGLPWLSVRDLALARTRLFACAAWAQSIVLSKGAAPADLSGVGASVRTDPYTGLPFGYLPLGRDFLVYSYGLDGKDDRGDTNADHMAPDILIEDAAR